MTTMRCAKNLKIVPYVGEADGRAVPCECWRVDESVCLYETMTTRTSKVEMVDEKGKG